MFLGSIEVFLTVIVEHGFTNLARAVVAAGVSDTVVPEDDVSRAAVAVNVRLAVDLFHVRLILLHRFHFMGGMEIVIELFVAAGPNGEAAAVGSDPIDVSNYAEVKRMAIYVTAIRPLGNIALGHDAVDATDARRRLQRTGSQELFRHSPHRRIRRKEPSHPVFIAWLAVAPVAAVPGIIIVRVLFEGTDPTFRIIPIYIRRSTIPQSLSRPGHQIGIEHLTPDEVAVVFEEADVFPGERDH